MNLTIAASTLAAITSLLIESVHSQRNPSIVGCLEVGCPLQDKGIDPKCTLVDKTYNVIGLASIPVTTSNLAGLTWTEGVALEDRNNQRNFNTNFYFGTPLDKNLTGTGACAVFFNDITNRVAFSSNITETSEGTCEEAMGSQCASALINRATNLDFKGLGTTQACAQLQKAFTENLDPGCANIATGSNWTGITVKRKLLYHNGWFIINTNQCTALTGPDAALPITTSQNASSNCWPVLPKQNSLALISSNTSPVIIFSKACL